MGFAPDFMVRLDSDGNQRVYLLTSDGFGIDVTDIVSDYRIRLTGGSLGIRYLCSFVRPVYGCVWCDVESAIQDLEESVRGLIEGRRVLLCYSGGKDSTLALILLNELLNRISFNLKLVYVHIPILDDPRGPDIASKFASKLGIDLEVIEARRRDIKSYMKWLGLPRLGNRWCAQFKVRPVKALAKKLDAIVVVADRATESPKRCRKLVDIVLRGWGKGVRKLYLIAKATLLDVISIVSSRDLIHPLYLEGATRVSCSLCPFKSIYEYIVAKQPLEDPGFVDSVLRKEYSKMYSGYVSMESFFRSMLWRFSPRRARALDALVSFSLRYLVENDMISFQEIRSVVTRVWSSRYAVPKIDSVILRDLCSNQDS